MAQPPLFLNAYPSQSAKYPNVNTSLCHGVTQFVLLEDGPGGPRTVYASMTLPHNCSIVFCFFFPLSPNRTNPEMHPNPVSRWLNPWEGSRKCLMVNPNDSVCILINVFHFTGE